MILNIPPEIVNKHRLLTKNEIDSYNLEPYDSLLSDQPPPPGYKVAIRNDEIYGWPCFIKNDGKIENAFELNKNYIFYDKPPSIRGQPHMHSLFIMHEPESMHRHVAGKSKKRKTKKSKKNKTNKK